MSKKVGSANLSDGSVNPADGVKSGSSQLPFDYWDVANEVVENRTKWGVAVIWYNVKTKHLFAAPDDVPINDPRIVKLFQWSVDDEDDLDAEDLELPGKDDVYEDFYEDDMPERWDSFAEYLRDSGIYDDRVSAYLVRKMEKENLAAKWAAQIQEAAKNG